MPVPTVFAEAHVPVRPLFAQLGDCELNLRDLANLRGVVSNFVQFATLIAWSINGISPRHPYQAPQSVLAVTTAHFAKCKLHRCPGAIVSDDIGVLRAADGRS